jgi:hypothetical protein
MRDQPIKALGFFFASLWLGFTVHGEEISFNRDVRPILSEHCFKCHGQDDKSRKGGLRLDDRDAALKGGKSGDPAIIPGKSSSSELIRRVTAREPDDLMPPEEAKKPLSTEQITVLKRWIDSGAAYQKHWAFIPPQRPDAPSKNSFSFGSRFSIRNPIDAFAARELARVRLQPSPEAPPEQLCRRLYLDLTGLPPSPRDVEEFSTALKKEGEKAYRDQVERLLASPRFGEKWARGWLDAARYADSDGFEKDLPREQWTWRDWVIRALNEDMPYDEFIVEQIAGDLLPGATQDQHVATGFLRNGMVNEEGAILAEQFRTDAIFDRMDCIGKSVLGLTIQCAQCHSHKYDPVTHEEYYRLFAFLNNDYEAQSWVYSPQQFQTIERIRRDILNQEEQWRKDHPGWKDQLTAWEEKCRKSQIDWSPLHPREVVWMGGLAHPDILPDDSVLSLGFRPTTGELYTLAETRETNLTGLRLEALTHGDLPFNGPGRSYEGTFAISEFYLEARPLGSTNAWTKIPLTNATADFAQLEQPLSEFYRRPDDKRVVGPVGFLIDGKEETAWGADRGRGRRHQDSVAVVQFATNTWLSTGGTELKIWFKYRHGGNDGHGRQNNYLGRFRLSATSAENPRADSFSGSVRAALNKPAEKRSSEEENLMFSAWREGNSEFKEVNATVEKLWAEFPQGEKVLNVVQRSGEWARHTRMLDRGNWQKPAKEVSPGVPAFLHSLSAGAEPNRLSLARWLVDRKSPTAARVVVNRAWAAIWGEGLNETPEDFGTRAPLPKETDLLDWLAVEFMDPTPLPAEQTRPWSLKHLLRVFVTSSTYRQSSRTTPQLLERDPKNQWFARGPRFRVDAEMVRDIVLSSSGLLTEKVGGPSVFPPMPDGIFSLSFIPVDFWKTATGPDRYRRSLYTFRRRSIPDPLLASFDAPNGDFACVRRMRSNTPLAALASLNEPVFVEASEALALRILREGGASDSERARFAFQLCAARTPRAAELEEIKRLLKFSRERAAEGWIPAREVAFGDANRTTELPKGATPTEAAAWTVVSRMLLNLDETITKN